MKVEEAAAQDRAGRTPHGPSRRLQIAVAAAVVALAATGLGARALAEYEWNGVVEYRSPYLFHLSPGQPTPPLTERVVLVIVDGLREDVARELPTFAAVAEEGSFLVARTEQPSLSLPGWTVLTSGAPPEVSAVTTNWYEGAVHVDNLFAAAQRAGLETAVVGHSAWEKLYGGRVTAGWFGAADDARSDELVGEEALRILEEGRPHFLVVHLPDVDNVGHARGVGEEYVTAAQRADAVIARILEAAGRNATVILTSDHGHVDEGGHGGPEEVVVRTPLVVAGPGTVVGAQGAVSQVDVAPTIAALLGVSRPTHATGSVLEDLLDAEEEQLQQIREAHADVEERFYRRAGSVVGEPARDADSFRVVQARRAWAQGLARLPVAVAVLVLAAIAVGLATRRLHTGALLAGVLTFIAAWAAMFVARGLTFSFSHFNTEDQIQAFLQGRLVDSVLAAIGAGLVAGIAVGRRASAPFRHGLGVAAWILILLAIVVAAFIVVYGLAWTWRLPNFSAAFAQYLALLAMVGVGLGGALVGLGAMGSAALFRRR